jgi:aminoglycoside phosphotransferase (APT) family kinase protein
MPQPPERNIEHTRRQLADWLGRRLPGATGIEVHSLGGPESTGFSSDTLMFDMAWSDAGRRHEEAVVVRLKPTGFQIFPEYDLSIQYRCMDALRSVGVPTPRVLWLEQDAGPLGAPFYVMERLAGRIPPDRPPYHMDGWMHGISPAERAAIWWSGLETMARIHRCDWQPLGLGFLDRPARGQVGLAQQLHFYREYLDWAMEGEHHPTCAPALAWLEAHRPAGEVTRLCWGDARIGNMIFEDGTCIAVLDWEMATLGNPVQDLAWYLYLDRHHSEGIGVARLEGFPGRDETIARWEALTGLPARETIDYYEIFAAFRFGVIMVRVGKQLQYYEFLPRDSDFPVNNPATQLLAKIMG